ncbi:MAG TPA: hypothetical protein VJ785_03590 [Anaerolineales bacterium]|nr:hypothetical protein [Anaerolineales bacterium]
MQQTFNDLYTQRRAESTWHGYVLWAFAETGAGIFREHVRLIMEGATMKTMISNSRWAPVISFILCVLPFMILEWATRSDAPRSDASPMLWAVLWLLSTGFIAILMLTVRNLRRAGNTRMANPVPLLLGVIFFVLLAWLWGALMMDQIPCFLGGSGC